VKMLITMILSSNGHNSVQIVVQFQYNCLSVLNLKRNITLYNCSYNYSTSTTVCPWNVLIGRSSDSLQTCMHWSVEHDANVLLFCQSTSSAGATNHNANNLCRNIQYFLIHFFSLSLHPTLYVLFLPSLINPLPSPTL